MMKAIIRATLACSVMITAVDAYADEMAPQNAASMSKATPEKCPDRFLPLDTNGDRLVSKAERSNGRQIFSAIDQNGDAIVSREEFTECLIQSKAFRARLYDWENEPLYIARTVRQFEQTDIDDDDRLSWSEYTDAAHRQAALAAPAWTTN